MLDRVLRPIKARIAAAGIRHSIYIDDGIILAPTKMDIQAAIKLVHGSLQSAGFELSASKSDKAEQVSQEKEYLGFIIDTSRMSLTAPPRKMSRLHKILDNEEQQRGSLRRAKEVASVIGKIVALQPALGPVVQLLSRAIQRDLSEAVDKWGWKARFPLLSLIHI